MTAHEQVWVKVNAPVDKGMAKLVSTLSLFPKLQTIESCQGTANKAWVCFVYGDGREELSEFALGYLGPRLARKFGDRVDVSVRVTETGIIRAEMELASASIPAVVRFIQTLRREAQAA